MNRLKKWQTLQSYECGRRRVPVSAMPAVAQHLTVSLDELFDAPGQDATKRAPAKSGPAPKWKQQIEQIANLRRAKQHPNPLVSSGIQQAFQQSRRQQFNLNHIQAGPSCRSVHLAQPACMRLFEGNAVDRGAVPNHHQAHAMGRSSQQVV